MDFNAFERIRDALAQELEKQGFNPPEPFEDPACQAVTYTAGDLVYGLFYDRKNQRFELRSTTVKDNGAMDSWKNLSTWLFDAKTGDRGDADSIANDFLEVIRGPKRVAVVQQKRKGGKGDERNVDPLFFLNRLVGVFPELKDELNEEKITYGQVRAVTFVKAHVAPRCQDLAEKYPDSEPCKKLCSLLDDMYKNGDMDVRSLVTAALLNGVSDQAFETLQALVGDELKKDIKYTRKLRGKKIKPEKKKKQKKVESRLKT